MMNFSTATWCSVRVRNALRACLWIGIAAALLSPLRLYAGEAGKALTDYDIPGLDVNVSVDLKGIDVVEALKFFAIKGEDLNIVASSQVAGTVHLYMSDVTVGEALQTLFAINRLAYVVRGSIIQVMSEAEYQTLYGVPFYDMRETRAFQLKYASAQRVARMLDNMRSERGSIVYNDDTGTLIIRDIPSRLREMEGVIDTSEIPTLKRPEPTETKVYTLQYAALADVQPEINNVLTPEVGRARFDRRTRTVIVTDLPHVFEEMDRLIEAFDRKSPEVYIEARIVQVTLSDNYRFGIDWTELSRWALPITLIEQGIDLREDGRLSLLTTAPLNQTFIIDALNTFGETELLSDPRITVEDGSEATLKVVTSEAYEAGTSEVDSGGVTTSYTTFEFVDVGVSLSVIPKINDEGFINMLIRPEVSSIASWYGGVGGPAAPRSQGSVPVIKRSTAETTVTIKDGVTIMIAGLIDESNDTQLAKFPILGDLPGFGKLFRSTSEVKERRETIIFLTPHIVHGDEPFDWSPGHAGKELKGLRQ